MKTSTLLLIALLSTAGVLATGCGTGDTLDHADGLHGTTRAAPATDLSDTGNYRFRNEQEDEIRGDTLRQAVQDTAFHKKANP